MLRKFILIFELLMLASLIGCQQETQDVSWESKKNDSTQKVVLFLGDSLTAGYGLAQKDAFPRLLQEKWQKQNIMYDVKNAGISGATSSDILKNINWSLTDNVALVFLCIGANDGLRGSDIETTKKNIIQIISICNDKKIKVVLAGIMLPTNYGKEYRESFSKIYQDIAQQFELKFMPFLLKDVAGNKELNLEDGIHPNKKGHQIIADNIYHFFMQEKILP